MASVKNIVMQTRTKKTKTKFLTFQSDCNCSLCFSISNLIFTNLHSSVPPLEFVVKVQEVKAVERQDALFEVVLSMPSPEITWSLKNTPLEDNEKFEISVSDDKLIHRLLIKDCMPVDAGIYAAIAGLKSCSAWLIVEGKNIV